MSGVCGAGGIVLWEMRRFVLHGQTVWGYLVCSCRLTRSARSVSAPQKNSTSNPPAKSNHPGGRIPPAGRRRDRIASDNMPRNLRHWAKSSTDAEEFRAWGRFSDAVLLGLLSCTALSFRMRPPPSEKRDVQEGYTPSDKNLGTSLPKRDGCVVAWLFVVCFFSRIFPLLEQRTHDGFHAGHNVRRLVGSVENRGRIRRPFHTLTKGLAKTGYSYAAPQIRSSCQ